MAVGLPLKTTYANGDVYSASDVNDTNGTVNLVGLTNNFYAGKNKIINGNFANWQRGTSFVTPSIGAYFADRFQLVYYDAKPTSQTFSQQTFTPGTAPVSGYESQYFMRSTITTVGSCTLFDFTQKIEDVRTFAGQTITYSFWAKADSARTVLTYMDQNFGSGGSSIVQTASTTFNLTTSWARFSATVTLGSMTGKTIGTSSFLALSFRQAAASGSVIDVWGVQVESGSTATAFQTATGTIQGELAACRYYYSRQTAEGQSVFLNNGWAATAAIAYFVIPMSGPMRNIAAIDYNLIQAYRNSTAVRYDTGTWARVNISNYACVVSYTHGSNVFTQGETVGLLTKNTGTFPDHYIGFSGEL